MNREHDPLLDAWRINDRVTTFLVEHLSSDLWTAAIAGSPRRTVRSIAAHLHNSRCMWMKSLAVGARISIPVHVDRVKASPRAVASALRTSGGRILRMLEVGLANGGEFPGVSTRFVWGAWPRNVTLFVAYAVSHEAHHRAQILLVARELGRRLPPEVVGGLWQWSSRLKESRPRGAGVQRRTG